MSDDPSAKPVESADGTAGDAAAANDEGVVLDAENLAAEPEGGAPPPEQEERTLPAEEEERTLPAEEEERTLPAEEEERTLPPEQEERTLPPEPEVEASGSAAQEGASDVEPETGASVWQPQESVTEPSGGALARASGAARRATARITRESIELAERARPAWGWARSHFSLLGAAAGFLALIGVVYLLATRPAPQPRPAPVDPSHGPWAVPGTPTPESSATADEEPMPEVWTRLAGLNVWIAGRRERHGERQTSLVIMLHGYGKPREALLAVAEREALRFGTLFLFPEAPVALDWRRRAWWRPRPANGKVPQTLPDGRIAARKQVLELLGRVQKSFHVGSQEIVLAGFSQGGTLAFEVALNTEEPLGGLAILSGRLNGQKEWHPQLHRLRGVPILMTHGRRDPVAPFVAADKLRRALQAQGVSVEWIPYEQGHVVTRTAQRRFTRFIARTISPEDAPHELDESAAASATAADGADSSASIRMPWPPPARLEPESAPSPEAP